MVTYSLSIKAREGGEDVSPLYSPRVKIDIDDCLYLTMQCEGCSEFNLNVNFYDGNSTLFQFRMETLPVDEVVYERLTLRPGYYDVAFLPQFTGGLFSLIRLHEGVCTGEYLQNVINALRNVKHLIICTSKSVCMKYTFTECMFTP